MAIVAAIARGNHFLTTLLILRQSLLNLWLHRAAIIRIIALPFLLMMIVPWLPSLAAKAARLIRQATDLSINRTISWMNSAFQILSYLQIPLCLLLMAWIAVNMHRRLLLNEPSGWNPPLRWRETLRWMVVFALIAAVLGVSLAGRKALSAGVGTSLSQMAALIVDLITVVLIAALGFRLLVMLPGVAIHAGLRPTFQATRRNWPQFLLLAVIWYALWAPIFFGVGLLLPAPYDQVPFDLLYGRLIELALMGFLAIFYLCTLSVLTNLYKFFAPR